MQEFDLIVLTTAADMERMMHLYHRYMQMLPVKSVRIIGNALVKELVDKTETSNLHWLDEEQIIPFAKVKEILESIFPKEKLSRGFVGWYYQQFLKMEYARTCSDEWYLCWDGDTIPVREISMFSEKGKPYLDCKKEYYPPYFRTISSLFPDIRKTVEMSFISEHMLFSKNIMNAMLTEIEQNRNLPGDTFYEKILRTADRNDLENRGFSEFETYGSYVAVRYTNVYTMRKWLSWRHCGQYFAADDITKEEMDWLGKDFDAITFEKGHHPVEEAAFIRDPKYRSRLSAYQLVSIIQENSESDDGIW